MKKIKVSDLILFLLYISLFKPYVIPSAILLGLKLVTVVFGFVYILCKQGKNIVKNSSLWICICIMISCLSSVNSRWNTSTKDILDGVLYALCLFLLFGFMKEYVRVNGPEKAIKKILCLYLVWCALSLALINHTFGISTNDANLYLYIFGNKFGSSYLLIAMICYFQAVYHRRIHKNLIFKILYLMLISFVLAAELKYQATTCILMTILAIILFFLPVSKRNIFYSPRFVTIMIISFTMVPFIVNILLKNTYIQFFVVNILHKSLTLTSRTRIYNNYIIPIIINRMWVGYGYTNNVLQQMSGLFTNAQNALLDFIIKFGLLGGVVLLSTIYKIIRNTHKSNLCYGVLVLIIGFAFGGMVEITYNWHFFLGLASLNAISLYYESEK